MLRSLFSHYKLAIREARFIRVSLLLAASLNALHWMLVLWFIVPRLSGDADFFVLHSTIYFGVDRIGEAWRLIGEPLFGTGLLVLNAAVASFFYVKDRLASAFLAGLSILLEALLLTTSFFLVLQNL